MRILHLFSDWKWTGPAEPALSLAERLAAKGHELLFACGNPPHPVEDSLPHRVLESPIERLEGLHLEKHFHLRHNVRDVLALRDLIRERSIDVVHAHRDQDHLVGGLATRWAGTGAAVVRTNHTARGFSPFSPRQRLLLHKLTDRLVEVSRSALESDRNAFGLAEDRVHFVDGAVDLDRFRPGKATPLRTELGIGPDEIVVGIVARVQRHRRFTLLFDAFSAALRRRSDLKLLIVGRGTHYDEVAREPIQRLGIGGRVVQAGYRKGDYAGILACFDMKVFLKPGTDGSCRAVREAMASGIPVIATKLGMLPEIVEDGTGILVEDSAEDLASAILRLAENEFLRRELGAEARRTAERRFDPAVHADRIEELYTEALEERRRSPKSASPDAAGEVEGSDAHDFHSNGEWPDVSVVLVNWNGIRLLPDALESVRAVSPVLRTEVILVDNASTDGSLEYVRASWPEVRLVENRENRGFGAANNQAFAIARGEKILLLNTDARLEEGTLEGLADFMDGHADCGAVTPALVGEGGKPQNAFDNFPTLATELLNKGLLRLLFPKRFPSKRRDLPDPVEVESALGACLLLRREALDKAGFFDEDFFFFLEETDLCRRLREAKYSIRFLPSVRAVHLGGASKAHAPAEAWIEYYRSLYLYFEKYESPWTLRLLRVGRFAKLILNTTGTFALLFFSMGMHPRAIRKFPVYVRLLLWHLELCPDDQGLRGRLGGGRRGVERTSPSFGPTGKSEF